MRRRQTEPRAEISAVPIPARTEGNLGAIDPKVINLSSRPLNAAEIKLLSKGLKFTPTPSNSNLQELSKDIKEYTRKLRLAEFFHKDDEDENTSESDLVRNKSNFNPKKGRNSLLDTVCNTLQNIPLRNEKINTRSNLRKEEEKAVQSLTNDCSIVIKEADKGGAVVIMNTEYYKSKILQMLNNSEFYDEISENSDKKTMRKIKNLIKNHNTTSCLTDKEEDFLINFDFRESAFYGLPKIHKSKTIKEAIKIQNSAYVTCNDPEDLTFRPIVGGPNAPTQRLSHLMDILLKPLCLEVKSYVRDDLDFLRHLPENVSHNAKLITMDVTNLYTNITTDLGVKALEYWIDKYPQKINARFSKDFILEASKIVLQNNTFSFSDKHYAQKKGTAMGTKMAPTYATLTLGYLEEKMYERTTRYFDQQITENIKNNWKRYLDDCFIIWNDSDANLAAFLNIMNDLDPDINFTMEESLQSIPFLDVLIKKDGECLSTDIYYKPTDTHQYLHFSSCHPSHTKRSIPYNLARRVCTIVSDEKTRDKRLNELKKYLLEQCYPSGIIEDGIKKATEIDRETLINSSNSDNPDTSILPLVTTYNPRNRNITPTVRHLNNLLQTDEKMSKVLEKYKFIN
ncbi:uncharacterized protein LOC134233429, partial [Saccostrea cucullata]|uniref:uncharacterized protein LOC134233429 n=1 Tax=Saccostrea cuccullata TaxID=36930 RepID=UPI002ED18B32